MTEILWTGIVLIVVGIALMALLRNVARPASFSQLRGAPYFLIFIGLFFVFTVLKNHWGH